jgi:WXG100 family type VII secretion target
VGASIIRVNYDQLEQISALLQGLISEHQVLHRRLTLQYEALRAGGWVSEESWAFYAAMETQLARYKRLIWAWDEAEKRVKDIRQTFSDAEEEAAERVRMIMELGQKFAQFTSPITDDQTTQLEGLGIVMMDTALITTEQAQAVIDFMTLNPSLLADGMTLAEAIEAIEIIQHWEEGGITLGRSTFTPSSWSLAGLRLMDEVFTTMSHTMTEVFLQTYSEEALIALAYELGLPAERVRDAPLVLMLGETEYLIDAGYNGGNSVAYLGWDASNMGIRLASTLNGCDITYDSRNFQVFTPEPATFLNDPHFEVTLDGDGNPQTVYIASGYRDAVSADARVITFYGLAQGNRVIFSDWLFRPENIDEIIQGIRGRYNSRSTAFHEISHLLDFEIQYYHDDLLSYDTQGLVLHPRSSNQEGEIRADILANGFMRTLEGEQLEGFEAYIDAGFEEQLTEKGLPLDFTLVPEDYVTQATAGDS